MLETAITAFGSHERPHGLGGLEEDEESGGGDLSNRYKVRVLPCFWVRSETVGQVGEGGGVVAGHAHGSLVEVSCCGFGLLLWSVICDCGRLWPCVLVCGVWSTLDTHRSMIFDIYLEASMDGGNVVSVHHRVPVVAAG